MKNRLPQYPGRVLLTPEDGSAPFYAVITRADEPSDDGTPINKETLLKDATAALYGLGADAVPDEVLVSIKTLLDSKAKIAFLSYVGTGTYGEANPCTLSFEFAPVFLMCVGLMESDGSFVSQFLFSDVRDAYFAHHVPSIPTSYTYGAGFGTDLNYPPYGKRSPDGKTVTWYHREEGERPGGLQYNEAGVTYLFVAIG